MSINLHHLRLFAAVVDHGGFTKAAAELDLSQPAISKSLAELERQLHVRLMDRQGRSATLTDAGRVLYDRAREIFGVEQLAERELREVRGLRRGRLRVAATATIATYVLPPLLARFRRRRSNVSISVRCQDPRTVARLLVESRVDVALSEDSAPPEDVETQRWIDDDIVVIAAPDHALVGRDRIDAIEIVEWPFLVDWTSPTRRMVERVLAARGVVLRRTTRMPGAEAVKQSVAAGLGLAVVSKIAATDQLALGRVVILPVADLVIRRPLLRLKLRGRARGISPAGREFESLLDESSTIDVAADATGIADRPADDARPGGGNSGPVVL